MKSHTNANKRRLMKNLIAGGTLGGVSHILGTHYEGMSVLYRLLGAKIGKRVYWPGSGIEVVEYDLLVGGCLRSSGSKAPYLE